MTTEETHIKQVEDAIKVAMKALKNASYHNNLAGIHRVQSMDASLMLCQSLLSDLKEELKDEDNTVSSNEDHS